jgi:hypothetical protein
VPRLFGVERVTLDLAPGTKWVTQATHFKQDLQYPGHKAHTWPLAGERGRTHARWTQARAWVEKFLAQLRQCSSKRRGSGCPIIKTLLSTRSQTSFPA